MLSDKEKLKKFISLRNQYIDMLEAGHISKQEFNYKNDAIFQRLNLRPFGVLDSFDKALFNYNYYNAKAKLALEDYNRYKYINNIKKAKMSENNKLNYYYEKDKATIAMILLEDASNIEAYYIKLHSKNLASTIFEILFKNHDRVILHSKSDKIKELLENKKVFKDGVYDSLIDKYVNNG